MLLGPESVSEPVRVYKHRRILIVPVSWEIHLCLVLTLLYIVQFALGDHQNVLIIECMFGTKKGEV